MQLTRKAAPLLGLATLTALGLAAPASARVIDVGGRGNQPSVEVNVVNNTTDLTFNGYDFTFFDPSTGYRVTSSLDPGQSGLLLFSYDVHPIENSGGTSDYADGFDDLTFFQKQFPYDSGSHPVLDPTDFQEEDYSSTIQADPTGQDPSTGNYLYSMVITVSGSAGNHSFSEAPLVAATPEPSALTLLSLGAAGLILKARKRKSVA